GRNDGDAQHLAKPGGEDEQPHQRAHQRRNEALALMQEAQAFAPHDALEADRVLRKREPACGGDGGGGLDGHAASPGSTVAPPWIRDVKAARISGALASATTRATGPCASNRP